MPWRMISRATKMSLFISVFCLWINAMEHGGLEQKMAENVLRWQGLKCTEIVCRIHNAQKSKRFVNVCLGKHIHQFCCNMRINCTGTSIQAIPYEQNYDLQTIIYVLHAKYCNKTNFHSFYRRKSKLLIKQMLLPLVLWTFKHRW